MTCLKPFFALTFILSVAAVACGQTTQTVRLTFDQIASDQDATSDSLEALTAVTSDTERLEWLATAAVADDFRESASLEFKTYEGLVPGNQEESQDRRGGRNNQYESTVAKYEGHIQRRVPGVLDGRVIYASAGHGWTNDNTSTSLWYTQRPITHGMIEDMGNLDQMNLYADLCFRAGATVVPVRPVGYQHIERVIDNDSGQALFHGLWADSESTVSFTFDNSRIPYRVARAALTETSVARFKPVIPVTDLYPVYCWSRSGEDRVNQTYRVVHAGGVTEVDVDHRKVGNGWVYLGSYYFNEGSGGYVEVTNLVRNAENEGGVVVADAVRFGNGMGDVNRGGGISGFPREEESSRYWINRAISKNVPPVYEAFTDREDQSNNVGAAPRYASHMNRETEGSFFDRLFLSFHSNASGGRGVVGLYNAHSVMRPDYQIELAKLTADELNAQVTSSGVTYSKPWFVRKVRTDGHINFGEIRRDYLHNEMSGTIVEVAFHDNADDAELLKKLTFREAVALSAFRATVRYFSEVGGQNLPVIAPPQAPRLLSVKRGTSTGTVVAKWEPAVEDSLSSSAGEIRYRLYTSDDGIVFDTGKDIGSVTETTITVVKKRVPMYCRVTAVSSAGESLPSTTLGAALADGKQVAIIQGAALVDDDTVLSKTETANLGRALNTGGSFVRLVPRVMNNREQVRALGAGMGPLHLGFESATIEEFVKSPSAFTGYDAVYLALGRQPVSQDFASTDVLTQLQEYVTSGGRLLISGACLAECDGATTDALERWGEFTSKVLQTGFASLTTVDTVEKAGDRDLTTITLRLGSRNQRYFDARPNEVLVPGANGQGLLAYGDEAGLAAVATLKDRVLRTAIVGFPLEEISDRKEQAVLVSQMFMAMGLELDKKPEAKEKAEPRVVVTDVVTTATDKNTTATKK